MLENPSSIARAARFVAVLLFGGLVCAAGTFAQAPSKPAAAQKAYPAKLQGELDALIAAAKAERELTFYSTAIEYVSKRLAEAFTVKYGVQARYLRISSGPLYQRFNAEADAGTVAADLVLLGGSPMVFAQEGIRKGNIEAITDASLPVLKSGEFPKRFLTGPTAIAAIYPWLIGYNTERLKGADIPKTWPDLLHPRFKGQALLPDPRVSDAYLDIWALILDTHGEQFFTQLRALGPRWYQSGVPAVQALAAGEGLLSYPATGAGIKDLKDKGGPVGMVIPDHTVGIVTHVIIPARSKVKRPNAGRLLAHYVLTEEGNKVFNAEPGNISVYDTSQMPKQLQDPKPDIATRKEQLIKLLGL